MKKSETLQRAETSAQLLLGFGICLTFLGIGDVLIIVAERSDKATFAAGIVFLVVGAILLTGGLSIRRRLRKIEKK